MAHFMGMVKAPNYEFGGQEFESLRARHSIKLISKRKYGTAAAF